MDPVGLIRSCITLVKTIHDLKQNIKSDDEGCMKFFKRIEAIQSPLEELQKMDVGTLNSKSVSLQQINDSLVSIDDILTKRVKQNTVFGRLMNAKGAHFWSFTVFLSELNIDLDRCIAAVQLAVSVDSGEKLSSSSKKTDVVHEDTQSNREPLDRLALALQQQASTNAVETQFVKDPKPVDEYDRRSLLGKGTFGVTHRMINSMDKGVYAVKEINVSEAVALGLKKEDLKKEAVTLQQLNHPHIVRYFTSYYSRSETIFNVVMELIEGGSLADKISDESVTVETIGKWLSQMASTLQYLHYEMRTQHRDIKPENIMLTGDGRIKLIDLGTASMMKTMATKMSRVGTSTYFSYEKANDISYDGRDDVWAAGCVFAELLTKSRLSDRGGAIYMFHNAAVNDRRLLLVADCVKANARLGFIVARMLEAEQEKRCTSVELVNLSFCLSNKLQEVNEYLFLVWIYEELCEAKMISLAECNNLILNIGNKVTQRILNAANRLDTECQLRAKLLGFDQFDDNGADVAPIGFFVVYAFTVKGIRCELRTTKIGSFEVILFIAAYGITSIVKYVEDRRRFDISIATISEIDEATPAVVVEALASNIAHSSTQEGSLSIRDLSSLVLGRK